MLETFSKSIVLLAALLETSLVKSFKYWGAITCNTTESAINTIATMK